MGSWNGNYIPQLWEPRMGVFIQISINGNLDLEHGFLY